MLLLPEDLKLKDTKEISEELESRLNIKRKWDCGRDKINHKYQKKSPHSLLQRTSQEEYKHV